MNVLSTWIDSGESGSIRIVRTVVVATEDPAVIDEVGKLLRQYDYSLIIEKSTIKSIKKILQQEIAFLILDLSQPSESHIDLIDIIKKARPRVPVIVLSDDNSLETVRSYAEAGVFYCALKPIQTIEIEKVIEAVGRLNHQHRMSSDHRKAE